MSEDSIYQQLRTSLSYLRLTAAAEALGELDHAMRNKLGHWAFLARLLEVEVAATDARRQTGLDRFGHLPAPWDVEDFDAQPSVDRKMIKELATLRFLEDATNVLLTGPPGVGSERRCWPSLWAGPRSRRAIAPTTRRPPTSPPDATGQHSRDGGRRPCAFSPDRAFS